jgi:hypothetical protein
MYLPQMSMLTIVQYSEILPCNYELYNDTFKGTVSQIRFAWNATTDRGYWGHTMLALKKN